MNNRRIKVTLKGWRLPEQHPSESCLPQHLFYSSNFESVKLIQSVGYNLADSRKAIEKVMSENDFVVEFVNGKLADKFVRKVKEYGAEADI